MMNQFQNRLFGHLCDLVSSSEAFYVTKTTNPTTNTPFWIFNYRIATFEDFCRPSAVECRGTMFEMDDSQTAPKRLTTLPMYKFFNLNENTSSSNLDLTQISRIEIKADGSLISTYVDANEVFLKTKGSLTSQQAQDAYRWVSLPQQTELWDTIKLLALRDFTVNMEWTSPSNRIVVKYPHETLTILNVRHNQTGVIYSSPKELQEICDINTSSLYNSWIETVPVPDTEHDRKCFVESIPSMKGIEGFVVKFTNGTWVKIKTDEYRELHRTKDNILNDRALYGCIVNESVDDLKALVHDDEYAMNRITVVEKHVAQAFNHMVNTIETFYTEHMNKDRKDFAVIGQQQLPKHLFPVSMEKYLGKDVDYKRWMLKFYDIYGVPSNLESGSSHQ